jgi:hypothetical protein
LVVDDFAPERSGADWARVGEAKTTLRTAAAIAMM